MNKVIMMGNVSKEIEIREVGEHKVGKFNIAVQKKFKKDEADFFNCVAWDKQAEIIEQYFPKGTKILVGGRIETRQYESQDGTKRIAFELIVEEVEFVSKLADNKVKEQVEEKKEEVKVNKLIQEEIDLENLPF